MMGGPALWVEKYIGIPFVERGSDFAGCNCWGLARLVYHIELSVKLPAFLEVGATEALKVARTIAGESKQSHWLPVVGAWQEFDIVLLTSFEHRNKKTSRYPGHVGVAASSTILLHIEDGIDAACMDRETEPRIKTRILGAYRYRHEL